MFKTERLSDTVRFSYALAEEGIREGIGRVREVLARATPQPKG